MRDWLLIDIGLDKLSDLARSEILVFRSGDALRPEPGDLQNAVDKLCSRQAEGRGDRPVTVILVPLDEAQEMEVQLSRRWGINNVKTLALGPNVD